MYHTVKYNSGQNFHEIIKYNFYYIKLFQVWNIFVRKLHQTRIHLHFLKEIVPTYILAHNLCATFHFSAFQKMLSAGIIYISNTLLPGTAIFLCLSHHS